MTRKQRQGNLNETWSLMGNALVRHHVPRKALFTPDDLKYLPVGLSVMGSERVTHIYCGGDSLKVVHRDSWHDKDSAELVMQKLWTGVTNFKIRRASRGEIATPSAARAGGEGVDAPGHDDEAEELFPDIERMHEDIV